MELLRRNLNWLVDDRAYMIWNAVRKVGERSARGYQFVRMTAESEDRLIDVAGFRDCQKTKSAEAPTSSCLPGDSRLLLLLASSYAGVAGVGSARTPRMPGSKVTPACNRRKCRVLVSSPMMVRGASMTLKEVDIHSALQK